MLKVSVDNPCVNSVQDYFKTKKMEMTIKYIGSHLKLIMLAMYMVVLIYRSVFNNIPSKLADPTYMIRAIPSNASDNVYCTLLAHSAIHGAMAGYSFTVGMVNGRHTYIPFYVSNNPSFIYTVSTVLFCLLNACLSTHLLHSFVKPCLESARVPLHLQFYKTDKH